MTSTPTPRIARRAVVLALAAGATVAAAAPRVTITVATFPDLDRAAKAALPRWNAAHPDIGVVLRSLQYNDHHTAMTTALAVGSGLPDVMAVDVRFIGQFAAGGGLLPLDVPPWNAGALRPRFVDFPFVQATDPSGRLVALPADIGPGTLLYRQDLLARAGLSEGDLTRDWDRFLAAARTLKARTGACLLADAADLRDILLRADLAPGEGLYFDARGRVLVDSPRFVRAFQLARDVRREGLDARATTWSNDWVAALRQDRVAALMSGAWMAGQLQNWLAPATGGRWRAAPLPGGARASWGGAFYAIPRRAAHREEAWAFIRFLAADRESQLEALRVTGAFPALREAQDDPAFDEPLPFLGGQPARRLWRDLARQVPAVPVNRWDSTAMEVVRAEFEHVVADGKDIHAALADARSLIERRVRH